MTVVPIRSGTQQFSTAITLPHGTSRIIPRPIWLQVGHRFRFGELPEWPDLGGYVVRVIRSSPGNGGVLIDVLVE